MITEQDLKEAIAECEGTKNPNANTCIKLAAYYTILDNLYGNTKATENYSYSSAPEPTEEIQGNSEFYEMVQEKGISKVFPVLEELMLTLQMINPRLYNSVMSKISEI